MEKSEQTRVGLVFAILLIPLLAGAFISTGWSWGFDHFQRLGPVGIAAFILILLALWASAVRRFAENLFEDVGRRLEHASLRWPLILSLLGLAIFAAFPIATRIYGDSRYILDDYSSANLTVHIEKMMSFGLLARGRASFVLHDLIARTTGLSFEKSYILVSVVCGAVFLFALIRLAAKLPVKSSVSRTAIIWLAITDGANQLFFGHVENYTLSRLFGSLFLIGVVGALFDSKPGRVRLLPILFFLLGVFFHSQTLVLLPTLLLWIAWEIAARRPALQPWVGARAAITGLILAVAGLTVAYVTFVSACYNYIYSGGQPHPRQLFLPLTTSCIDLPYLRYTLFSGSHLIDLIGSLYSISSPAIILVLLTLGKAWRADSRVIILAASIVTAGLHNFILNPAIGFPFDWDLMSVISPPLLFTAVFLIARAGKLPRGLVPAIIALGLGTVALFGINANSSAVRGRVEDMGIWLHRTYYGGSHYRLSANLSTIRNPEEQVSERLRVLERLQPQTYPDDREVAFLWEKVALAAIDFGDYEPALRAYWNAFKTEPSRWDRKKPIGYLETEIGDPERGIPLLREYLRESPNDAQAWFFLGQAQLRQGLNADAERSLRRSLELDPRSPEAPRIMQDLQRLQGPEPNDQ